MNVATAYCLVVQKVVDELLAKGITEPSTGSASFYSNVLVAPKFTDAL